MSEIKLIYNKGCHFNLNHIHGPRASRIDFETVARTDADRETINKVNKS